MVVALVGEKQKKLFLNVQIAFFVLLLFFFFLFNFTTLFFKNRVLFKYWCGGGGGAHLNATREKSRKGGILCV